MYGGESRFGKRSTKVSNVLFEIQDLHIEQVPLSDSIVQLDPHLGYRVLNVALIHASNTTLGTYLKKLHFSISIKDKRFALLRED